MNKPKKLRVTVNGEYLRDIYPHATRFQVFKFRVKVLFQRALMVGAAVFFTYTVFALGSQFSQPNITQITAKDIMAPVLEKIAKCESSGSQYQKNGQVVLSANKNGSVDVGKYQINVTIWGKQATKLGYDLTKPEDNRAMAEYLYLNYGTEPWSHTSGTCWTK